MSGRKRGRSGNPALAASAAATRASEPASRVPSGPLRRLVDTFATEAVPAGVDYPHALRTPVANPFTAILGVTLGLLTFMVVTPLASQALGALYWLAVGRPGTFAATYADLIAYRLPFGLAVGHLALALLIPLSWALVLFVHRVRPGIVSSVAGRLRWRWLVLCLPVAFGALWLVLALQTALSPDGWTFRVTPQQGAVWFLAIMMVTTPLQAAAEEYFFRGYLMQALGSTVRTPWFGILASAAIFTLFHGLANPALVGDRFAFGVLAGWLVVRTGGLEAPIAAHVANNVMSFGLAALTTSVAEVKAISEVTWAAAGWDVARFATYALFIVLLARRVQPQTRTAGGAHGRNAPV